MHTALIWVARSVTVAIAVTGCAMLPAPATTTERAALHVVSQSDTERFGDLFAELSAELDELSTEERHERIDSAMARLTEHLGQMQRTSLADFTIDLHPARTERAIQDAKSQFAELKSAWEAAVADTTKEREAAEAAAAAAAAEAKRLADLQASRAPSSVPKSTQPRSTSSGVHRLNPWVWGDQAEIDACRGPVYYTRGSSYVGAPYVSEHWHCGGSNFPRNAGAIVEVPGQGTYVSHGIVIMLTTAHNMSHVPGGYDLYFQTCLNNDTSKLAVIGLSRL